MARRLGDGKRLTYSHSMRAHQVHLKFANLVARNAHVAQLADTGGDGVRHAILRHQCVHHGARPVYGFASLRSQKHRPALHRDFPHRFQRQIVAVDVKSFQ